MDKAIMESALAEAKSSLAEYSTKAAKIKIKMDALQNVVSGLEALLGSRPSLDSGTPSAAALNTVGKPEATWKIAQEVLARSGPMTVPEIFTAIEATIGTSPAKDAIRIAMMRKPEVFVNENGKYRLVPAMEELLGGVEQEQEAALSAAS